MPQEDDFHSPASLRGYRAAPPPWRSLLRSVGDACRVTEHATFRPTVQLTATPFLSSGPLPGGVDKPPPPPESPQQIRAWGPTPEEGLHERAQRQKSSFVLLESFKKVRRVGGAASEFPDRRWAPFPLLSPAFSPQQQPLDKRQVSEGAGASGGFPRGSGPPAPKNPSRLQLSKQPPWGSFFLPQVGKHRGHCQACLNSRKA